MSWAYFSNKEMMCKCGCGKILMSELFMEKLVSIRKLLDIPLVINSAYRCKDHNESVGGKPDSAHVTGQAVDISLKGMSEENQIRLLEEAIRHDLRGIGVKGKGRDQFIHIDNKRPRLWSY